MLWSVPLYREADLLVRAMPQRGWRAAKLAGVVLLGVALLHLTARYGTLDELARHEAALRQWGDEHPILLYAGAFGLYALVTAFVPSAAALSLAYSWYFGFWRALVLLNFASTAGGTLGFLVSRYWFREVLTQRHGERLAKMLGPLNRDGAWYLFALRLSPVVPFALVNAVMGLSQLRVRTFWWVSQLGMLPGKLVCAHAGSSAPGLQELAEHGWEGIPLLRLMVAFTLLGCCPLVTRYLVRRHLNR